MYSLKNLNLDLKNLIPIDYRKVYGDGILQYCHGLENLKLKLPKD